MRHIEHAHPEARRAPGTLPVLVNYDTANGTAGAGFSTGAGTDYVPASGMLNFAAGETTKVVRVELLELSDLAKSTPAKIAVACVPQVNLGNCV